MNDLISIIIPIYNTSKYLKKCLESVINQSYKNIEIICINDGSTDNSLEILKSFKEKIFLIDKKNSGVSDTRNIGVEKANGKYIMFLDSDDWLEENSIEDLYNKLKEQNVDAIRGLAKVYNSENTYIVEKFNKNYNNKKIEKKDFKIVYDSIFIGSNKINCFTPLLLIKKEFVPKFNTNLFFLEDNVFYLELYSKINSIYFYDKVFYNYRFNSSSTTKNYDSIIKNILGMVDAHNVFKNIVVKNNILIQNLSSKISVTNFNLLISKLNLIKSYKNYKKFIINNYDYIYENILKNVDINKLNQVKKVEYKLLVNKKITMLYLIEKIKKILK